MVEESIKSLHKKCQVTMSEWSEQPWTFLQIRKVSIYITWLFLQTSIKPNTMSLIGLSCSAVVAIALVFNFLILAAIFILFFIVMDFSDGEVSRYRGQTSKEGSYLDKIYIFVGHPIIIAGVAIYQIQMDNSLSTIVLGFSCTVFVFAFSMVVDYTKKIVIWAHFEKLISSQDYSDSGCGLKVQEKMVRPSAEDSPEKFVKLEWIYRKLHSGIAIFDFPYIFLLLSLVILMEAILPIAYFGGFTPIHIFIYTFGIAYPLVTVAFLIKNIFQKRISQQYTELVGRIER